MQNIVPQFFRLEGHLRLQHWNTRSFARHKASDDAIGNVIGSMDRIVESLIGHVGRDVLFLSDFKVHYNVPGDDNVLTVVESFMAWLRTWDSVLTQTDILNLRDELLGHLAQFLQLATLS